MLKRLRRKFMLIITGLVGLLLLALVVVSSLTAQSTLDQLVSSSLDRALDPTATDDDLTGGAETGREMSGGHLAVVWVDLSTSEVQVGGNQSSVDMDADVFGRALRDAITSGAPQGRIEADHVTWRRRATATGSRIAIADTSGIDAARKKQVASDIALGLAALAILLAISWVLARWALAPVEQAWSQQRQFVADASHELKTPLAVILANAQILSGEGARLDAQDRRWVDGITEESERMKGLVEDLLELSRTEEGDAHALAHVDVDLSSLVEGAALQFDAVAFELDCSIESRIAEGVHVTGDPEQLTRLVKTLVDNACKYAAKGTEVSVTLERTGSEARICVTNLGEPIPAEDLPHLFDRFYRSDRARARETGGFGLGLAIAKGIVDAHRGKVSVTSDREHGTRFVVRLPGASQGRAS